MIIVIFTMLIIIVIVFPIGIYSVIFTMGGVIEKATAPSFDFSPVATSSGRFPCLFVLFRFSLPPF